MSLPALCFYGPHAPAVMATCKSTWWCIPHHRSRTEAVSEELREVERLLSKGRAASGRAGATQPHQALPGTSTPAAATSPAPATSGLSSSAKDNTTSGVQTSGSPSPAPSLPPPPDTPQLESLGPKELQQRAQALRAQRKALSHELLGMLQGSYRTWDVAGRPLSLLEVYERYQGMQGPGQQPGKRQDQGQQQQGSTAGEGMQSPSEDLQEEGERGPSQVQDSSASGQSQTGRFQGYPVGTERLNQRQDGDSSKSRSGQFKGFPAGTGDCCAPKLLHAAAVQGLKPLSLLEFW